MPQQESQKPAVNHIAAPYGAVLSEGRIGAVLARAGVGKTAVLVQIAIENLLAGRNVLHVSLDQPVRKVCLWYEEVFGHLAGRHEQAKSLDSWEAILPYRFIMTFALEGFNAYRLEERVADLSEQGIFHPQVLLVDGLDLKSASREVLSGLELMVKEYRLRAWFAIRIHREDGTDEKTGLPEGFAQVADMFESALLLAPQSGCVCVKPLLGAESSIGNLVLDPATLLVSENQ
jgi:hypothetical protein